MKKIIFFLIIFFPLIAFSQEVLTGLQVNPILKNNKNHSFNQKSTKIYDTLPFIDDFSYNDIYPARFHWKDNYVFINNEYPLNPVTIGVATFDALDQNGKLYKDASPAQFSADTLTSIPIRLDSTFSKGTFIKPVRIKDSVWFSFYYQPQGIGNAPNVDDSLVLEFYSPKDTTWNWIWSTEGMTLDSFLVHNNNKYFKNVMIPILDSAKYYHKDFRFRFRNYASIALDYLPTWGAGITDQWHLDYVYLNINRSKKDTILSDVAFTNKPTTFLKTYQSMPYDQFKANRAAEMESKLVYPYFNYSTSILNVDQLFKIYDLSKTTPVFETNPPINTNGIMPPFSDTTFIPTTGSYTFPDLNREYADFEVLSFINTKSINDKNHYNDTARFIQRFYNYYAYDDGNPESGYGLSVIDGKTAYRFDLNKTPDTLRSIQIFFNTTAGNTNQNYFYLTIWDEKNGVPNNIIYKKENVLPEHETGLDVFHTYVLDSAIILKNKTFFIGTRQTTKDILNIGFDLNTNHQDKIFINYDGNWYNSMYKGSLMMRPVLGSEQFPHVGIDKIDNSSLSVSVYPNPFNGNTLNIKFAGEVKKNNIITEIYSSIGKKVYSAPYSETIHLPDLSDGIYIMRLVSPTENIFITKKIMVR